jgi:cell division septation protein DedD
MTTTGMDTEEDLDQDDMYDATEADDGKWGALRMIGLLALLAAFAGFVYLAYMQGVRNGAAGAPPVITAEKGSFKEAPPTPGGTTFENTDKVIYDRVDADLKPAVQTSAPLVVADGPKAAQVDTDSMADAKPATRVAANDDIAATIAREDGKGGPVDSADEIVPKPVTVAKPTNIVPAPGAGTTAATTQVATSQTATPVTQKPLPKTALVIPPKPTPATAAPAPQIVATTAPTTAPPPAPAATASATAGAYVVQIASYRDMPSAQDYYSKFTDKFSDVASGLSANYQTADIPGKGTYIRVRVGPFSTKEDANSLCNTLKERSQSCLVVKG